MPMFLHIEVLSSPSWASAHIHHTQPIKSQKIQICHSGRSKIKTSEVFINIMLSESVTQSLIPYSTLPYISRPFIFLKSCSDQSRTGPIELRWNKDTARPRSFKSIVVPPFVFRNSSNFDSDQSNLKLDWDTGQRRTVWGSIWPNQNLLATRSVFIVWVIDCITILYF